jgi:hypothetical protein
MAKQASTRKDQVEYKAFPSARRGRQSAYTPELGREVCEHLADGGFAAAWCRKRKIRPALINKWMEQTPEFEVSIARARRSQFDCIAEDCVTIADAPYTTMEQIRQAQLRIDTRMKLLGKWDPQRYGDRLIEDKEVRVTVTVNDPTAAARAIIEGEVLDNATQTRQITQDD